MILQLFRYADWENLFKKGDAEAHYAGIAFEPYPLEAALSELKTRGIPFNDPESHISTLPDGSKGTLSTTVVLPSLSKPGLSILLVTPTYLLLTSIG